MAADGALKFRHHVLTVELRHRLWLELEHAAEETKEGVGGRWVRPAGGGRYGKY